MKSYLGAAPDAPCAAPWTRSAWPDKNVFGFHQQELHFIATKWTRYGAIVGAGIGVGLGHCCAALPLVTVNAHHLAKLLHLL